MSQIGCQYLKKDEHHQTSKQDVLKTKLLQCNPCLIVFNLKIHLIIKTKYVRSGNSHNIARNGDLKQVRELDLLQSQILLF